MSPMHYSAFQEGKNSKQLPAVVNGKSGLTSRLFVLGGGCILITAFSEASQLRMLCVFTCVLIAVLLGTWRKQHSVLRSGAPVFDIT